MNDGKDTMNQSALRQALVELTKGLGVEREEAIF
jgi:hypothetical protein